MKRSQGANRGPGFHAKRFSIRNDVSIPSSDFPSRSTSSPTTAEASLPSTVLSIVTQRRSALRTGPPAGHFSSAKICGLSV